MIKKEYKKIKRLMLMQVIKLSKERDKEIAKLYDYLDWVSQNELMNYYEKLFERKHKFKKFFRIRGKNE